MQFNGPTYRLPRTMPELRNPANVVVENTLRVWAVSRWRGSTELANFFLTAGYRYLPPGSPVMFNLQEIRGAGGLVIGLTATFTNPYDAYRLLGRVY